MTIVNIQIYLTVQLLFIRASFFPVPGSNQGPWFTFGSCVSLIFFEFSQFSLIVFFLKRRWAWCLTEYPTVGIGLTAFL